MIVDTSVIIAILRHEPEADIYSEKIEAAPLVKMSAANYLEAAIVADRSADKSVGQRFNELCRTRQPIIVPFDEQQARLARQAYRDFGKGSGHAARLNFGDCFAYALARASGEPLLYKGTDFGQTDVASALD